MKLSENCDKIAKALVDVGDSVRFVGKGGENKYDKYSYAKLDDYVRACAVAMKTARITVLASSPEVVSVEPRTTKNGGTEHVARVRVIMRAVHESGQWAEIESWGEGQDRADKSVYKANTGARKYGYAMLFGLATSDDPEADEGVGQAEPPAPNRAVAPRPVGPITSTDVAALVAQWSGMKDADLIAAMRKCIERAGVQLEKGEKLTQAQAALVHAWVKGQIEAKADFIAATGGK